MSLVRQTSTYFLANAASAVFGLLNVVIFTRLIGPGEYGIYVVGNAFCGILTAVLFTWLRQAILREESKEDSADIRGTVVLGFAVTCLASPLLYFAASYFLVMDWRATAATIALGFMVGFFELGQELLRARQRSMLVLRSTILRAVLVSTFGTAAIVIGGGGASLLFSGAAAYLAASGIALAGMWRGTKIKIRDPLLRPLIVWGLPLTLSMAVLAVSAMVDRFTVAYLLGAEAAGKYGASVDLVRQSLIIPAISASAAFVPIAVRILAKDGERATAEHLKYCLELLSAITLPCCIGFALLAPRVGNVILGPEFRDTAASIMPVVAIAVIVQILVNQYLHISFLLANKNRYYIINTAITLVLGTLVSALLIAKFGLHGAAWGRVASEAIGLLSALVLVGRAFPMPFSGLRIAKIGLATLAMAAAVAGLNPLFAGWDKAALAVLIPLGAAVYFGCCWLLDVIQLRAKLAGAIGALQARRKPREV